MENLSEMDTSDSSLIWKKNTIQSRVQRTSFLLILWAATRASKSLPPSLECYLTIDSQSASTLLYASINTFITFDSSLYEYIQLETLSPLPKKLVFQFTITGIIHFKNCMTPWTTYHVHKTRPYTLCQCPKNRITLCQSTLGETNSSTMGRAREV